MGGHKELEEGTTLSLDWHKLDKVASKKCDVVPVVVQDTASGAVLNTSRGLRIMSRMLLRR